MKRRVLVLILALTTLVLSASLAHAATRGVGGNISVSVPCRAIHDASSTDDQQREAAAVDKPARA
jgi:hypothetical protein